jgi:hypothetical protein
MFLYIQWPKFFTYFGTLALKSYLKRIAANANRLVQRRDLLNRYSENIHICLYARRELASYPVILSGTAA